MKIKNLTSVMQKIEVESLLSDQGSYEVYIEPNGETELLDVSIVPTANLGKYFEIEGAFVNKGTNLNETEEAKSEENTELKTEETQEENESVEEEDEESGEVEDEDGKSPIVESSKFICDICHAEFASARGLTSHKNRVHTEK